MTLPKTWTQIDGNKIAIKKMETSHLIHSIAMIERNHVKAQFMFCEYSQDWMIPIPLDENPHYLALWKELNKRKK